MKNRVFILLMVVALSLFSACEKDKDAFVTFGANYHVIDCISYVTIYLDGKNIGQLQGYTDTIKSCGQPENITKSIVPGKHSYKIEIRPDMGVGCKKDIEGTFKVKAGECHKVFIDYFKIDWE